MLQIGTNTEWSHEAFLALPIQETQHKLQCCYSNALYVYLFSLVDQRKAIKIMSAAGPGAAAFLHAPEFIPGCALSNQEFEIATKLRLGTTILANLPTTCICGSHIDGTWNSRSPSQMQMRK